MRIEINPVSKPRMTQRDKWAKRPCVVRYYSFKDELRRAWGCKEVPDQLNLIFYLPMPSSWSKKRRNQMLGKPHQSKPDIDNLIKSFLDCLLENDARIWDVKASKRWAERGAIEVRKVV